MKKIFYLSLLIFILYEFFTNYFLMLYPGSQKLNSLELSHNLYFYKIPFEVFIVCLIIYPTIQIFKSGSRFLPASFLIISMIAYYYFNFYFTAENKFRQPNNLTYATINKNTVAEDTPIIGVEINGEAKAFPVSYILYHHQIIDKIGGKDIMITYCGVCRTGRVYEPYINHVYSKFRLVGLNRFNAMFEDEATRSWWSQETGSCIAGKLKGEQLPEVHCSNMSLYKWLELYSHTKIMQPDPDFVHRYRILNDYDSNIDNPVEPQKGGTWANKTYIVGIASNDQYKAYEWNVLVKKRIINDTIANKKICLVLSADNKSFIAFESPDDSNVTLRKDTIHYNNVTYNLAGLNLTNSQKELKLLSAYREYWFSWQYAYPDTERYIPFM